MTGMHASCTLPYPQIKRRKCMAPPEVVRCLSVLRFQEVRRPSEEEASKGETRWER